MATSLEPIATIVKTIVPKCPAPVINRHLHRAARELCRSSLAWTAIIPAESVVASSFPMEIVDSSSTRVIKILSVRCNDLQLELSDVATEEIMSDAWRSSTGVPLRFVEESPGQLLIVPLPDEECSVEVEVAIEPASSSMEISESLLLDCEDTLVAGTVHRLCMIPGQPWSSPELAAYYKGEFYKGVDDAKVYTHRHRRVGSSITMNSRLFSL
jgi:hypothetical protein